MMRGLILSLLFIATAQAGSISAPYDLDSTSILPKNVRSPRYKSIFLRMEEKFGSRGQIEALGASLNKQITFQTLVDTQKTSKDKALAEGTITANGIALTDSPGATTGRVNTFVDVKVPVFSYGITEKWTAAVVVPVYKITVSADTGFVATEKAQTWAKSICNSNPEKCTEIKNQLADPVNLKAASVGYKTVKSEEISAVGDVKLISKHELFKKGNDAIAIKGTLTLPTGTHPNVDKLVDTATGDGQTDIGARLLYDRKLSEYLWVNTFAGYTAQLPDSMERRIPVVQGDPISPDKERLRRDSGDQMDAGIGVSAGLSGGFTIGFAYSYQYMNQTSFRGGSRYESHRYKWLEELTPSQEMTAGTLGIGYSTINAYKAKEFALPISANISYGRPFTGRNVSASEVYSAEMVMFF